MLKTEELAEFSQTSDREIELVDFELVKERFRLQFEEKEKERQERLRKNKKLTYESFNSDKKKNEKELEFEMRDLELEHTGSMKVEKKIPINFVLAKSVSLVPKFNKHAVDAYFLSFEKIARNLNWPEKCWLLLLQSTFVGKAQRTNVVKTIERDNSGQPEGMAVIEAKPDDDSSCNEDLETKTSKLEPLAVQLFNSTCFSFSHFANLDEIFGYLHNDKQKYF